MRTAKEWVDRFVILRLGDGEKEDRALFFRHIQDDAITAERERCAKIAESLGEPESTIGDLLAALIAAEIRDSRQA